MACGSTTGDSVVPRSRMRLLTRGSSEVDDKGHLSCSPERMEQGVPVLGDHDAAWVAAGRWAMNGNPAARRRFDPHNARVLPMIGRAARIHAVETLGEFAWIVEDLESGVKDRPFARAELILMVPGRAMGGLAGPGGRSPCRLVHRGVSS